MKWIKTKTALAIAASTLVVAGAGVAITRHNRSQGEQSQAQMHEAKLQAERAGGSANVAADPNAQKKLDEQKALPERQK